MANDYIYISGIPETVELLRNAGRIIFLSGLAKALSAGANVLADAIEEKTPVKKEDTGGLLDKGVLRESIRIKVELDARQHGGRAIIDFGPNGAVANFVEFGHRIIIPGSGVYVAGIGRKRPGTYVGDVPAHPFILPAVDGSWERAVEAFANSLMQTVTEEFHQGQAA